MSNGDILKVISTDTINSIQDISVVTPSIYASIFSKFATEHGEVIEDEEKLSHDLISQECSNLTNLQNMTSKNVQQLSENTTKALHAIKDRDESVLKEVLKETSELRQEILKLKEAVYKDELTYVFNRKYLHDHFLNEEDTFNQNGVLAIIDLNYFKIINDTYGHIVGDKVLIFIAAQLKKLKASVIRYGGDEFIIIFKNDIDLQTATSNLNKLREAIIAKKLKSSENSFRVSFSIGADEFKKGDSLTKVIELADKKMYDDKIYIKKIVTGI